LVVDSFLRPHFNLIIAFVVLNDLAKSFGKSTGFAFGLFLLSFIFLSILGFGSAQYHGPQGRPAPGY